MGNSKSCCTDANTSNVVEKAVDNRPGAPEPAKGPDASASKGALWSTIHKEGDKGIDSAIKVLEALIKSKELTGTQQEDVSFVAKQVKGFVSGGAGTASKSIENAAAKSAQEGLEKDDELDENTKTWLMGSFNKQGGGKKVSIRQVGLTIMAARKLVSMHKPKPIDMTQIFAEIDNDKQRNEVQKIDSWMDFNVFKFAEYAGSMQQALIDMGIIAFKVNSLDRHFGVNQKVFRSFITAAADGYKDNPYHNGLHAADVVQSFHCLLRDTKGKPFSEIEILSGMTAAIVHDVGHPGVTNSFHVNATTQLAITYSDQSVNEYMHLATCWQILSKEENNWMSIFLNDQRNFVKKSMLELILATDMANHFTNIAIFKKVVEDKGRDVTRWEKPVVALEELMHAADVSNPGKTMEGAHLWTDRVLGEFFAQGDKERELGLPVSNLCDRFSVSRPGSQVGFVNFVVKPLFVAVKEIANLQPAIDNMDAYANWNKEALAKEKAEKEAKEKAAEEEKAKVEDEPSKADKQRRSKREKTAKEGAQKLLDAKK